MTQSEPEWLWEYSECERCGQPATHRLYWGAELMHEYCEECGNQKFAEMAWYDHELMAAANVPADGPLSELTPAELLTQGTNSD